METRLIVKNGQEYLQCIPGAGLLASEADALDLVGACWGFGVKLLLLDGACLPDDFYDLKTGLAGAILQKFVNYQIRLAAVIPMEHTVSGRFAEMVLEANRGRQFRFFETRELAESWLVGAKLPRLAYASMLLDNISAIL